MRSLGSGASEEEVALMFRAVDQVAKNGHLGE
jgi:hypothetical protein